VSWRGGGGTAVLVLTLAVAGAGCGGGKAPSSAQSRSHVASLPSGTLPSSLGDLTVQQEQLPSQIRSATSSYAKAVGFYSLRKNKLVEGTLEVVEFNSSADWASPTFRTAVADQVSGGVPDELTLAGHAVYQSPGTGATLDAWFSGRYLFVLTIRSSYSQPRSLTESALEMQLG